MIKSRRVAKLKGRGAGLWPALDSVWAVEESIAPGTRFPLTRVPRLTLAANESGMVTDILTQPPRLTHTPRNLVVLPPRCRYLEVVEPGEDWHIWYVMLHGPWADHFVARLRDRYDCDRPIPFDTAPVAWRHDVREATRLALDQPPGWSWAFLGRLATVFGEILASPARDTSDATLAQRACRLVDSDPHRPWSVPELAAALNVAESTLAHRFRESTGLSPALWVRRRRVEAGKHLLAQGMSVVETSRRLGFANPYHFSRVFKSVAGAAPSEIGAGLRAKWLH